MGSLIEELEAREAVARALVEELEAEIVELTGRPETARETLSRLVITRETVAEVMAGTSSGTARVGIEESAEPVAAASSPFAGAEARVIGVLTVPKWQPGLAVGVLPKTYRDIMEVVADAPGPVGPSRSCPGSACRPRPRRSRERGRN